MIQLKTRTATLAAAPLIASEISKIQNLFFEEETLALFKADGEEQVYLSLFDGREAEDVDVEAFTKIIGLKYKDKDLNVLITSLAEELTKLLTHIQTTDLVLISHLDMDFFGNRTNQYAPLVAAYQKLEAITSADSYKGTIEFGIDELATFVKMLFWITRCDPSSPEVLLLFDTQQRFAMTICKHGNIHLTEYSEELLTEDLLASMGWKVLNEC